MNATETLRLAQVRRLTATGEARRIREDAHLSQADVEGATRIPRATISRWERGLRAPRGPDALRYLDFLEWLGRLEGVGR